jgi:hypothetical protein
MKPEVGTFGNDSIGHAILCSQDNLGRLFTDLLQNRIITSADQPRNVGLIWIC